MFEAFDDVQYLDDVIADHRYQLKVIIEEIADVYPNAVNVVPLALGPVISGVEPICDDPVKDFDPWVCYVIGWNMGNIPTITDCEGALVPYGPDDI